MISIILFYKIFNFPKNKKEHILSLAMTNTITGIVVCTIHIVSFLYIHDMSFAAVFPAIIICVLIYLHKPFPNAIERIYKFKYNDSIQSVVVKKLTKITEHIQSADQQIPKEKTKRCPYCGEEILAVAIKCKHCGEWMKEEPKE